MTFGYLCAPFSWSLIFHRVCGIRGCDLRILMCSILLESYFCTSSAVSEPSSSHHHLLQHPNHSRRHHSNTKPTEITPLFLVLVITMSEDCQGFGQSMALSPPQFQEEDQTDEDFFGKLVDEDDSSGCWIWGS
ncbi:hypothetical protein LWI29_012958 [Acer saccharum]|uniref:Uncharacterized protein n=1 Tax=Acer saccharum TaxID=4024 RepID=A0AA39S572_ACESA|nr:hypothetical protein LWI29_012958 [Acer saccharum]